MRPQGKNHFKTIVCIEPVDTLAYPLRSVQNERLSNKNLENTGYLLGTTIVHCHPSWPPSVLPEFERAGMKCRLTNHGFMNWSTRSASPLSHTAHPAA